ncbi:hypothetical protein COE30_16745 [Bacillus cereus]|uniref:DUF6270 domain-containing protein n=1 Tax=Bacillus cereus TaxID=1396 RepID=UPI000BFD13FD|nr:DUF6270 domain-containing protein [Bacillus cereus]PGZ07521.1 hypothetical protein COE30_16745 [Bacillus cereus]
MDVRIEEVGYNPEKGNMTIIGTSTAGSGRLILRKKRNHRDFEFPLEVELGEVLKGGKFQIDINLKSILEKQGLNDDAVWLIHMISGENEYVVKVKANIEERFEYFYSKNSIFKLIPYIAKDGVLAFYIRGLELAPFVKKMEYLDGKLSLNILLTGKDNKYLKEEKIKLIFKRRNQVDMAFHGTSISTKYIPVIKDSMDITMDIAGDIPYINQDKETCWDVFVNICNKDENEYYNLPLEINSVVKKQAFRYKQLKANNLFYIKPYVTGDNRLAIYQSNMLHKVRVIDIIEDNESIKIDVGLEIFNDQKIDELNLVIKRREKNGNGYEYYEEFVYDLEESGYIYIARINKKSLSHKHILRDKEVWDFFIRLKSDNNESDLQMDISKQYKGNFSYFDICCTDKNMQGKLFINGSSQLSLYIIDEKNRCAIKVAVLGTCFSRNAFNSSKYFNPDYKKIYECVYTQFHSSLISLVSKPVSLDLKELENIKESDRKFVEVDFDKSFFNKLKESEAEYLILDLYSDASKSILKIDSDRYISCSYILEDSKYITKLENSKIIDHTNNDEYFEIWKDAVGDFIRKLKNILPEDKIILNKGRFTPTYFDEHREVKSFSDPQLIYRNNYFWEKLDNYIMHLLPKAKVIDLTNTSYIGDATYPFGKSFSHYESGYYKEFLNRLNSLVISDRLSKW